MKKKREQPAPGPGPGPHPQWSSDGQWWWDGSRWTEMWQPPHGLAWDGQTWVRIPDEPEADGLQADPQHEPVVRVLSPYAPERPLPPPPPTPPRPRTQRNRKRTTQAGAMRAPAEPQLQSPPPPPPPAPPPLLNPRPAAAALIAPTLSQPPAAPPASPHVRRLFNRATWLVAGSLILLMAGISVVELAGMFGGSGAQQNSQYQLNTGRMTPAQIAKALAGRTFTRNVVPPELAQAAPFRDVFVANAIPGLAGEVSTSTTDLGGTVTIYVFSDPAWAQAFFEEPPIAYGCGVCTSMAEGEPVPGVGDKATSYVLYRKTASGKGWIATTTYVLAGTVVINGLYYPVNVANPYPTATDLSVPTAYGKAGLQMVAGMLSTGH